jgi:glycosyltransferase involved in cell wall biosynthesis
MHEAASDDADMDYMLKAKNIQYISLGRKPHAVLRTFFGNGLISPVKQALRECDILLVRAPTHLFGAWARLCARVGTRLVPLLVGDYAAGNLNLPFSFPKKQIVQGLNWYVNREEKNYLQAKEVVVNSHALAVKYKPIAAAVHEIRTTTLSRKSFHEREDTCQGDVINILYTGRFDWQKGLQELVEAFVDLVKKKDINARLHFAGWQDSRGPSIEENIMQQAGNHNISNRIVFHGKKRVGPELDAIYRMADIYVLPSYAEGFPRAIWEAMANSLPVIATQVGSIPDFLQSGKHALLVPPRDVDTLAAAILQITTDMALRQGLIVAARGLAKENTLEIQAQKLVTVLNGK